MHLAARHPCQCRIPEETRAGRALPAQGRLPRSVRDLQSLRVPGSASLKAMCSGRLQTALLVAGYFVYLLVGAAVFQALERTAEKQEKRAAAQMKEAFLQNFTQLTVAEMEQFMEVSGSPFSLLFPRQMLFPTHPCCTGSSHCFSSDCGHLDDSSKPLSGVSRQLTTACLPRKTFFVLAVKKSPSHNILVFWGLASC